MSLRRSKLLLPLLPLAWFAPVGAHAQDAQDGEDAQEAEVAPFLRADDPDAERSWEAPRETGEPEPARILATLGAGTSMRIVNNLDFSQKRFAPGFIDAFGAYVLPSTGFVRHGVGLGLSMNVSGDGSTPGGVDGFEQLVVAPTYVAHMRPSMDLALTGKAGIPFAVSPEFAPGLDLSAQLAYLFTAGLGIYGEVGFAAYLGGDAGNGMTFHPLLSAELGVLIDYEVLP